MKVFFDTNVYVAEALLGAGALKIMGAMRRGRCRVFVSAYVVAETAHVLTDYMGLPPKFVGQTQQRIVRRGIMAEGHSKARVPDDAKDTPVLRAALACGAHYLVSSDRHLLSLDPYESLRIVSMSAFIEILVHRGLL